MAIEIIKNNFEKDLLKAKGKFLVEFKLKMTPDETLQGVVIDISDNFLLLQKINDDFVKEGYSLLRNIDISQYRIFDSTLHFKYLAMRKLKIQIARYPKISMASLHDFLNGVHNLYPLISVYRKSCGGKFTVGIALGIHEKVFNLLEIDSDAEWDRKYRYRLNDIVRIDFGAGYEHALWAVGKSDLRSYKKSITEKNYLRKINNTLQAF